MTLSVVDLRLIIEDIRMPAFVYYGDLLRMKTAAFIRDIERHVQSTRLAPTKEDIERALDTNLIVFTSSEVAAVYDKLAATITTKTLAAN